MNIHETHTIGQPESSEANFANKCLICGVTDRDGGRALSQPCKVDRRTQLTLDEKMRSAGDRGREKEAEKHFYDLNQPFFPLGFSVFYRNPGHWDISAQQCPGKVSAFLALNEGNQTTGRDGSAERAFRIRGEPGHVVVFDERWNPHRERGKEPPSFKSVMGAMLWIMEELMQEPAE